MNNVLKFGVCFGAVLSLAGCGTSEHFMQDDVYNTRTPMMPPGTDLNDVTDYATFVAKKEQTEVPQEQTTYVSPRQYNDYFYHSQYVYYGYSPYAPVTGLGYYGYSNYYYPSYPYGYSSAYYGYGYNHSYYTGTGWGGTNSSWYTPSGKPNTSGNLSNLHAGTSAGRMGSSSSGIVNYENKLIAKPTNRGFSSVGRNSTVNSSPVLTNGGRISNASNVNSRVSARPVVAGRVSAPTERTGTYNRTTETRSESGVNNRTNTNTNSSIRTSTPSVRSGSSGGSVSSPSSGGGARSGGRR